MVRSGITGSIFVVVRLGVTVITNNSVASIVGSLICIFVIEAALIRALLPKVSLWLPMENADAFVSGNGVGAGSFFRGIDISLSGPAFQHEWIWASVILAGWAALAFVVAIGLFKRRDID